MWKNRLVSRLAAGCLIICGSVSTARAAAPTVEQMLAYRPHQDLVQITTPTPAELAYCKVEAVSGPGVYSGWLLRDGRGQILRRFGASKGAKAAPDTFSYFLDGQEVYREFDQSGKGKFDNYRWFGAGGMRWGVDVNQDGQIDYWRQISAEEVSQEILRAIATKNSNRLRALIVSEEDLKVMELSPQEINRIHESVAKIPAKFQEAVGKLGQLGDTAHWLHLETAAPQCLPAESTGGKYDVVRYRNGTIVYEVNGKADFLQTGELIQVRGAWRLAGAPAPGHELEMVTTEGDKSNQIVIDDAIKNLISELGELDKAAPKTGEATAAVRYNLARAGVLEKIAAKVDPKGAEQWVRQVADCYSAAAQASGPKDLTAFKKLSDLHQHYAKAQPGSPIAGYIAYREMSAEYSNILTGDKKTGNDDLAKVQEGWRERLKKFVEHYPTAEDAPDALLQLGMISEFVNKDTEAKNYYEMMVRNYGQNPNPQVATLVAKAQGGIKRLTSDGKVFDLTGPALGNAQAVNIAQLRGKTVVVYYWASWNAQCAADFIKLKTLLSGLGSKGVELVCVSLDNTAAEAQDFISRQQTPGVNLFQPGGLDSSPLAVQYGVMVLPTLFLVDRDGKVVSHTVQMSSLEDEIKKLLDK